MSDERSENKSFEIARIASYPSSNDPINHLTGDDEILSQDLAYDTVDQAILRSVYQP